MGTAEIILAFIQTGRLALEIVEKYQRGELTEEQLQVAWDTMKVRLGAVSERIRS